MALPLSGPLGKSPPILPSAGWSTGSMGKGDIHMTGFWKRLWRRNSTESSVENATTCFGPGVEIEGKINVSAGTIRVNTRVKGEISSNGSIEVGPRGELDATVRARAVIVAGKVN